ncbi:MAG: rhodanese-like domain-containing protein [Pseudomonadota bacterium]
MDISLSRRRFGLLALSTTCVPIMGFAGPRSFAHAGLLEDPEALLPRLDLTDAGRPRFEIEGTVLIDTRPIDAYLAGHIPGARHLDPNAVASTQSPVDGALKPLPKIEAILNALGIAPDKRVVFYDDRGGFHAARMFWLLEYLGHRDVALLNGGWTAWQALQGPQSVEALGHVPATFQSAPSPRKLATADYILAHEGDPDTVVVDVRPGALFAEVTSPGQKTSHGARTLMHPKHSNQPKRSRPISKITVLRRTGML